MTKIPPTVDKIVTELELEPHPEGGYFREIWRSELTLSSDVLPDHPGERSAGTSIVYLLETDQVSALHRVRSDELWFYQMGDPMKLEIGPDANDGLEQRLVGPPPDAQLQVMVPAGWWQSATPAAGPAGYSLVACVVVPGFDFADFEMLSADDTKVDR